MLARSSSIYLHCPLSPPFARFLLVQLRVLLQMGRCKHYLPYSVLLIFSQSELQEAKHEKDNLGEEV
jgi:hypothetical protein